MDKATYRLEMKEQLATSMNELKFMEASRCLSLNLLNYLQNFDLSSFCIGVFSPIQREPVWFLELLDLSHLNLAIVQIEDDDSLGFYKVDADEVSKGIPLNIRENQLRHKVCPDMILVPGLAFSTEMERLGRGKGYYDKYLKDFKGETIGLCFELQLVSKLLVDEHDILMNKIITEKNIY